MAYRITMTRMVKETKIISAEEAAKYIVEAKIYNVPNRIDLDLYCKNLDPNSHFLCRVASIPAPHPATVDWNDPDALLAYARANLPKDLDITWC